MGFLGRFHISSSKFDSPPVRIWKNFRRLLTPRGCIINYNWMHRNPAAAWPFSQPEKTNDSGGPGGGSPLGAACAKRMLHLLKNNTFLISENSSLQPLFLTRRVHNWHSSLLTLLNPITNHNWDASDAVIAPALITFLASKTALKKQLHCDFFRLKSLPLLL